MFSNNNGNILDKDGKRFLNKKCAESVCLISDNVPGGFLLPNKKQGIDGDTCACYKCTVKALKLCKLLL